MNTWSVERQNDSSLSEVPDRARERRWARGHAARQYQHQVEPDPGEVARRYGLRTSVLDWRERLICSRCGGREVDNGAERDQAALVG